MSSDSDVWEEPQVAKRVKKTKRAVGESNLKGFASAFATIMDRSESERIPDTKGQEEVKVKKVKEERVMVAHDTTPLMTCDRESQLKLTAEKGVVKLFRAVAVHRKRAIEKEANRGIGVTKSGKIRERRRPAAAPSAGGATKSMASFLETLKKSKPAPLTGGPTTV